MNYINLMITMFFGSIIERYLWNSYSCPVVYFTVWFIFNIETIVFYFFCNLVHFIFVVFVKVNSSCLCLFLCFQMRGAGDWWRNTLAEELGRRWTREAAISEIDTTVNSQWKVTKPHDLLWIVLLLCTNNCFDFF